MGAIHGFLGGVLFTSSIAYFGAAYVRQSTQFVSSHFHRADRAIHNRILSNVDILRENEPINSHSKYIERANLAETSKDIWNEEIIKMVNWVYSINWYKAGIQLDQKLAGLGSKIATLIREQ